MGGSVCIDGTSFTTQKKICKDGIFIDEEEIQSCPEGFSSCFQCGMNAACFTNDISANTTAASLSKARSSANNNCVEGSLFAEHSENDPNMELMAPSSFSRLTFHFNTVISFFL